MTVIIVSGTRHATQTHRADIEFRLSAWRRGPGVTLVHGKAPGVDTIAAGIGAAWGWTVVEVPALWQVCNLTIPRELGGCPKGPHLKVKNGRPYCPYAGNRRNQKMVDDFPQADPVLAFPERGSAGRSGTWDLVHRAADADMVPQVFSLAVQRPETLPLLTLPESTR